MMESEQSAAGKSEKSIMNEVNKTLFIPLYGKSMVSKLGIILNDPDAEKIWEKEGFPVHGKSKSKWLAYNMAMRARVFDMWTEKMLLQDEDALVLHIGCGLDSRCERITLPWREWIDCDLPDVIAVRKKYYTETDHYHMLDLNAADPEQLKMLPCGDMAIVILEGLSMYLTHDQLRTLLHTLQSKYNKLRILMDVYTEFGAHASKYKNPVNDVGVTTLYGIDDINSLTDGTQMRCVKEHTFTPASLVDELKPADRTLFKLMFTGRLYKKIYRLYELWA